MGVILNKFKEFHANYSVLEKIDNTLPKEVLRWKYNQLEPIIKNLHSKKEIIIENIKNRENYRVLKRNEYFCLIFEILTLTLEIYVFSEWYKLIPLFQEQNIVNFLYFIHLINESFKTIVDSNNNYDSMIENTCDLGRIIELLNFEQLIYANRFPELIQENLRQFINNLLE